MRACVHTAPADSHTDLEVPDHKSYMMMVQREMQKLLQQKVCAYRTPNTVLALATAAAHV